MGGNNSFLANYAVAFFVHYNQNFELKNINMWYEIMKRFRNKPSNNLHKFYMKHDLTNASKFKTQFNTTKKSMTKQQTVC